MAVTCHFIVIALLAFETSAFLFRMEIGKGCGGKNEIQMVRNPKGDLDDKPCTLTTFTGHPPVPTPGKDIKTRLQLIPRNAWGVKFHNLVCRLPRPYNLV